MPKTELLLKTLLDEFIDILPTTEKSVVRDCKLPKAPGLIHTITGMRRTGKTEYLFQIIHDLLKEDIPLESILYLNFEDDRLLPLYGKGLATLLDTFYTIYPENHERPCYFFLDEVQNITDWEVVVRRFHDTKKVNIFLSGASAKLLSKEIATSLRGRSIDTEIWPYSFNEYLRAHDIDKPEKVMGKKHLDHYKKYLVDYMITGGFPQLQAFEKAEQRKVLQSYVDTVIFRDIIERYEITNIALI